MSDLASFSDNYQDLSRFIGRNHEKSGEITRNFINFAKPKRIGTLKIAYLP